MTVHFSATPLTLMARIMGLIMGPLMRSSVIKCLEEDLQDIKDHLEKSGSTARQ